MNLVHLVVELDHEEKKDEYDQAKTNQFNYSIYSAVHKTDATLLKLLRAN